MTTAHFIIYSDFWDSLFIMNLRRLCDTNGIKAEPIFIDGPFIQKQGEKHVAAIMANKNVATWGTHFVPLGQFKQDRRNLLFLENSCIGRGDRLFVDSEGWLGEASYVLTGQTREPITSQQRDEVLNVLKKHDMHINHGGNRSGPILVALQKAHCDPFTVEACSRYLPPNKEIVFRLHPSDRSTTKLAEMQEATKVKKNWHFELGTVNITERLKDCSALVAYNSGAAITALAMGIRTATLGRGLFSGSCATLECDKKPGLLRAIMSFKYDRYAAENLLYCIYANEIPIAVGYDEIFSNVNIQNWLRRMNKE